MAGATFEQSSLASVPLREMAQAMSTPVGSPAYFSGKVYNVSALNGQLLSGMKLGTDHPYVGIAGKPSLSNLTRHAQPYQRRELGPPQMVLEMLLTDSR